jgi:glutathione S-transferase
MSQPNQPIIIHHIEGRRSERVAWLCEEFGWPYELKYVPGDVMASLDALGEAHVMRMAPIIEDGPLKMVESGAILEYLLLRYGGGRFRPADDAPEMANYLQWLHFAEGSGMFRALIERVILRLTDHKPPEDVAYVYIGASRRVLDFAEAALAESPYFAGDDFTVADIMMHFPLRAAGLVLEPSADLTAIFKDMRSGLGDYPNINAFLDRIVARPAFQLAMATTMPDGPPPR